MKICKKLYVILLCVILAAPLLLMPFASSTSAEKRQLSAFPSLIDDGRLNMAFTSQLDTWLCEHFPFRPEIISANNYWKSAMFDTSDEQQVIVGKDDWLYFAETVPDYCGENALSDYTISKIKTTLSLVNEAVNNVGADFVFTVAPNKNTIYPQYMPARYPKTSEPTNLERLETALAHTPYFVKLTDVLRNTPEQAYHKRDSHWNAYGALLGYRALMQAAKRPADAFDNTQFTWKNTWRGDLDDMIFPALDIRDKQAEYAVNWSYDFTSNYHSEEGLNITTENENGDGNLLMYRDSFGNALLPFMAQSYRTATFSRVIPYDFSKAAAYDTVILEIVERNIADLLCAAPIIEAPTRDEVSAQTVTPTVLESRQKDDLWHIYGTLPFEADTVYLQLTNEQDTRIIEAFPLVETALLQAEKTAQNGFSAYVPSAYQGYTITVLCGKDESK